jgi:hypothetical protein
MLMFLLSNFWLVAGFSLTAVAGLILLTDKPKWNDFLAFGVITTALLSAWIILHPRQTPLMDNSKLVQQMIGAGTPVLLEFQSPY